MESLMKNNVKELAQSVMALLPGGEVESEVAKRKKGDLLSSFKSSNRNIMPSFFSLNFPPKSHGRLHPVPEDH